MGEDIKGIKAVLKEYRIGIDKKARDRRDPSDPAPSWCWAFGVGKARVGKPCLEDCRVKTNKKADKLTKKEKRPLSFLQFVGDGMEG